MIKTHFWEQNLILMIFQDVSLCYLLNTQLIKNPKISKIELTFNA